MLTVDVSRKIENMSVLSALLVVCIHISANGIDGFGQYVWPWFPGLIMRMAVPFFFVASGFFLAGHIDESGWWRSALRKRVSTLLMPYVVLNMVWFVVKYSIHWYGVLKFGAHADTLPFEWTLPLTIFGLPPGGPVLGPLWYVRNLILLVVLSPLMVYVVRKSLVLSWVFVACAFVVWTVVCGNSRDNMWFSCAGFSCFWLGILFRRQGLMFCPKWVGVLALIGVGLIGVFHSPMAITVLSPAKYLLCIIGIWSVMPAVDIPRWLKRSPFAIYVFHTMFIYVGTVAMKLMHRENLIGTWAIYFLLFVFAAGGPCVVAWALETKWPLGCRILLGNRVGRRK